MKFSQTIVLAIIIFLTSSTSVLSMEPFFATIDLKLGTAWSFDKVPGTSSNYGIAIGGILNELLEMKIESNYINRRVYVREADSTLTSTGATRYVYTTDDKYTIIPVYGSLVFVGKKLNLPIIPRIGFGLGWVFYNKNSEGIHRPSENLSYSGLCLVPSIGIIKPISENLGFIAELNYSSAVIKDKENYELNLATLAFTLGIKWDL